MWRGMLCGAVMFGCCLVGAVRAQEGGNGEQQPLKNVKVLTGKTRKEVVQIMKLWSKELGQKCLFCHVKNDMPNDEKKEKLKAREMYEMQQGINDKFAAVEKKVSCYTCHRGSKDTINDVPAGEPAGQ